ncbi:CoA ester lyase [Streptomyces capparidis]
MVDLEDSVPPREKEEARRLAETFFCLPSSSVARCAVRINTVLEPDGMRDLLALRRYPVKPAVVLVPMVESPRDIEIVERVLGEDCPATEYLAVVETPRGLEHATAVAGSSRRLRGLIFGSADYSLAMGARLSWECLAHARARVVNSARAAGIEALDAPWFDVSDLAGLRREAVLARDLGFSGKIAVHPRQIPVINETFSPDEHLLDRARRVAAAGRGGGIAVVDGSMVGRPFFEASRRLLRDAESSAVPALPPAAQGETRL